MVKVGPDGDGGHSDSTANGGWHHPPAASWSAALGTSGGEGSTNRLFLNPDQLNAPTAVVGKVSTDFSALGRRLAESSPEAIAGLISGWFAGSSGIFGDPDVESAWSAFHQAWVAEIGMATSAVAELAKLLPAGSQVIQGTDHTSGQSITDASRTTPSRPPQPNTPPARLPSQHRSVR